MKSEVIAIRKSIPHFKNMVSGNGFNGSSGYSATIANTAGIYTLIDVEQNTDYTVFVENLNGCECGVFTEDGLTNVFPYTTLNEYVFNSGARNKVRLYIRNSTGATKTVSNWVCAKGKKSDMFFYPLEEYRIKERLKDSGSVKDVRIRFYSGVEKSLRVRPYLLHKAGRAEDFFTYPAGTEPYITGDDDQLQFPVLVDFDYDDEVVVDYENVGDYPYTLVVDIVVSYYPNEVIS